MARGAKPGDVVAIDLIELTRFGSGKSAILRDFGVLRREFPEPMALSSARLPRTVRRPDLRYFRFCGVPGPRNRRLPSGVIATATCKAGGGAVTAAVGWVATDTVPTGFTFLPSIASTLTESSARLATNANVPARLIAGPKPACQPPPCLFAWAATQSNR